MLYIRNKIIGRIFIEVSIAKWKKLDFCDEDFKISHENSNEIVPYCSSRTISLQYLLPPA